MEEVKEEEKARGVDWAHYFRNIRKECPWSYVSFNKNKIDIVTWKGEKLPLGDFDARVYVINAPDATVVAIAQGLDYEDETYEWLYSYPGYGEYATPVSVIIQQWRAQLNTIRNQINE